MYSTRTALTNGYRRLSVAAVFGDEGGGAVGDGSERGSENHPRDGSFDGASNRVFAVAVGLHATDDRASADIARHGTTQARTYGTGENPSDDAADWMRSIQRIKAIRLQCRE